MSKSTTSPSLDSVSEKACAKINLALHVTGRRNDGYHLLDSLVVFADYGDELCLSPATKTSLAISGPFGAGLETENDNLILRAHRVLSDALKTQLPPTRFNLVKNLPVSSGIGGGSADAAAALRGLIKLWRLDVTESLVAECALKLGADVPVCLKNTTCQMQGIGEIISPIKNFAPLYIMLVNSGVTISTPSIFSQLNLEVGQAAFSKLSPFEHLDSQTQWINWLKATRNDLQEAAQQQSDEVAQTLAAIQGSDNLLFSRMSGSGATCFGLYAHLDQAQKACAAIKRDHPQWWAVAAPVL